MEAKQHKKIKNVDTYVPNMWKFYHLIQNFQDLALRKLVTSKITFLLQHKTLQLHIHSYSMPVYAPNLS